MANGFRTIPSLTGQLAAATQIEAQRQNILEGQLAAAIQQERLQQLQSPQNQALQQLQQQLQTATIQQQLKDLANPQGARLRAVQDALALKTIDPASGIIATPIGLGAEVIATPGALTEAQQAALPGVFSAAPLTAGQRAAFPDVVDIVPTAAPGAPLQPITVAGLPTGFTQDIERAVEATQNLAAAKRVPLAQRISEIEARAAAQGIAGRTFVDEVGNVQFIPSRMVGGEVPTATQVRTQTGEALKAPVKAAGGLSQFAIANISGKAGKAGLTQQDIDEKYTKDNVVDWNRLNLDANRLIQDDVEQAAKLKASSLSAAERGKATSFIAAHKDLGKLGATLKEFKATGRDPDAWERAVGVALESPPDGVWSALYQTAIGQGLQADTRDLNALKARVRSAVTKANAGLSQTEREIANVTQYSPATNDNLEQTLGKAAGLEEYLVGQVESITTDPREWLSSLEGKAPIFTPPGQVQAPQAAPPRVTTREQYNALQPGTRYIDSKGNPGTKR